MRRAGHRGRRPRARTARSASTTRSASAHYRIDLHPSTGGDPYIDLACLPFQLPLGALVPERVENLLAAGKSIGTTHITNGAYRLHPVEWGAGEAAGHLAAFCSARRVPPRAVCAQPGLLALLQARAGRGRRRARVAAGGPGITGVRRASPSPCACSSPPRGRPDTSAGCSPTSRTTRRASTSWAPAWCAHCRPSMSLTVPRARVPAPRPVVRRPMPHRPTTTGATRSPFPPIADYGFLSDCETTALVAPGGNIEWLCLPRMDSPSVFGAMLDRDAGALPARPGRREGPGRPPLPAGHDGARDELGHARRLDHRPRRAADRAVAPRPRSRSHTHGARRPTTTPTTCCCARSAASTARCSCLDCEPAFEYGAARELGVRGDGYHEAVATRRGPDVELRAHDRHEPRHRGPARHRAAR